MEARTKSAEPSASRKAALCWVHSPGRGETRLPNPAVLERYEAMGVKVLRSDRHGAITFVNDGKDLKVQTFLKKEPIADLGLQKAE